MSMFCGDYVNWQMTLTRKPKMFAKKNTERILPLSDMSTDRPGMQYLDAISKMTE